MEPAIPFKLVNQTLGHWENCGLCLPASMVNSDCTSRKKPAVWYWSERRYHLPTISNDMTAYDVTLVYSPGKAEKPIVKKESAIITQRRCLRLTWFGCRRSNRLDCRIQWLVSRWEKYESVVRRLYGSFKHHKKCFRISKKTHAAADWYHERKFVRKIWIKPRALGFLRKFWK